MRKLASYITLTVFGILLATSLGFGVLAPQKASADCQETGSGQYCLLEPLPMGGGQVYDKYDPKVTTAADYINLAIKVIISIIGVLGVIMIVLGGVQYMTTDAISKKEGGKEMISNAIFGLILALVSWLLLNTINPALIEIRLDPPKGLAVVTTGADDLPAPYVPKNATINGQQVVVNINCSQTSINAAAADGVALDKDTPWGGRPVINNNDADYRSRLLGVGVTVNKSNCPTVGASNCTTVYKLGNTALLKLGDLRTKVCGNLSAAAQANCKIVVTGGTECWLHKSHEIGSGIVDLSITPELSAYIVGLTTKVCGHWIDGTSSDGCPMNQAGFYTVGSTVFVKESDHYHIKQW